MSHEEISWQFVVTNKDRSRNIKIILLAILTGVGLWVWQRDSLTLVVLGVAVFAMVSRLGRPARPTNVKISSAGLDLDHKSYWFKDMKSFWIHYSPGGIKELSLEFKKWYDPYLRIPLMNQDPVKIRTALIAWLPEKEHELSMSDILFR